MALERQRIKKILKTIKYATLNSKELEFTDGIHKVFPELMTEAFEKDVIK